MCGCRYLGVVCTKRLNMVKALGTEPGNEEVLHRSRVRDRNREIKIERQVDTQSDTYVYMCKLF